MKIWAVAYMDGGVEILETRAAAWARTLVSKSKMKKFKGREEALKWGRDAIEKMQNNKAKYAQP